MDVGFFCDECGGLAATVRLLAPTGEPAEVGSDRWKLEVNGPVPTTHWVLRDLDALHEALRQGSVTGLAAIDPEYANFRCPECSLIYCKRHWEPITPEMDEGFYDATYGTCPKGHRIMLDD